MLPKSGINSSQPCGFLRVMSSAMAPPAVERHRTSYPIPQGFDLGPPDVGALQVTLSSHFGALASAVNQYKLPDAALQFINYDTGLQDERSVARGRVLKKRSACVDIMMQIFRCGAHPLPQPEDVMRDVELIVKMPSLLSSTADSLVAAAEAEEEVASTLEIQAEAMASAAACEAASEAKARAIAERARANATRVAANAARIAADAEAAARAQEAAVAIAAEARRQERIDRATKDRLEAEQHRAKLHRARRNVCVTGSAAGTRAQAVAREGGCITRSRCKCSEEEMAGAGLRRYYRD